MGLPFELTGHWFVVGLLLVLYTYLFLYYRRSLVDFGRGQRRLSLATRIVIMTLLILSLAGLTLNYSTSDQYVVFVADTSMSVGEK